MSDSQTHNTIDFLKRHAPFEQMAAAYLEFMAKRLKTVFYAQGQVICSPDDGSARRFYIIKEGRVRAEAVEGQVGAWELMTGECFPIGALLAKRPVRTRIKADVDCFCYVLERDDFDQLLQKSTVFHDFCTRRIANLLDNALRAVQERSAAQTLEAGSLSAPLASLLRREPVTVSPETSLRDAMGLMAADKIGSLIICDADTRPLGVFTLHDVLERVTLAGAALDTAISTVMSPQPVMLSPQAPAYEAALLMAQHGIRHICVTDKGRLVGVVSERDLFSMQRIGIAHLSRALSHADSIDGLVELEQDVHRLIVQMLAQGASVAQLTQIISALNDALTRRVIELVLAEHFPADHGRPPVDFTWLAFGSEGRNEQTLKTDQDNGMLFRVPAGKTAEAVREELLPLADKINQALHRCGFPLCPGNIMARNPACCLSLEEWRARFGRWIDQGTPEHLLQASIYFDFRVLWGDTSVADALRDGLLQQTAKNSRFRWQLAANALRIRPPLGLIRDFAVSDHGDRPNTLDLKLNGITPFVDAARIYALAVGSESTNTVARLHDAARKGSLNHDDVAAWTEAYHYIQLLRMRTHRKQSERDEALSNLIDPDELNELDRRILKEAFRQARKLQSRLALDYPQ